MTPPEAYTLQRFYSLLTHDPRLKWFNKEDLNTMRILRGIFFLTSMPYFNKKHWNLTRKYTQDKTKYLMRKRILKRILKTKIKDYFTAEKKNFILVGKKRKINKNKVKKNYLYTKLQNKVNSMYLYNFLEMFLIKYTPFKVLPHLGLELHKKISDLHNLSLRLVQIKTLMALKYLKRISPKTLKQKAALELQLNSKKRKLVVIRNVNKLRLFSNKKMFTKTVSQNKNPFIRP